VRPHIDDAEIKDCIVKLLFDPRFEGFSEAGRLRRAQAVVAALKVTTGLESELREEIGKERSAVVKKELEKAV